MQLSGEPDDAAAEVHVEARRWDDLAVRHCREVAVDRRAPPVGREQPLRVRLGEGARAVVLE